MKLNIFKQIEYKPKEITALCSTDKKIFIFRSNKSCEVINSISLQVISYINLNYVIVKCSVYKNILVCISEPDQILWIDIKTFSVEINKIGYKILDFILHNNNILLTTLNGLIIEIYDKEIGIKYKTSSILSCILHFNDIFLVGSQNKMFIFDVNFKLKNELEIKEGFVKKIKHFRDNKFGLVTDTGDFILLDVNLLNILQKIEVRNSMLNVLLFDFNTFYTAGDDSRLICYKFINDLFVKGYQIDLHYGIHNCILLDNKRLFVGNSDGILSVLVPHKDKFIYTKIYDRSVQSSIHEDLLLINNRTHLDLFNLKVENRIQKVVQEEFNYPCTYKISKSIKNEFSVKNLPFSNLLRIYSDFILSSILSGTNVVSGNSKGVYIFFSNSKGVNIFFSDSKGVNKLDVPDLEGIKCVDIREENDLIILKNILGDLKFLSTKNLNFVEGNKYLDDITNRSSENELFISKCGIYKLVQVVSYDMSKTYIFYENNKIKKEITTLDLILGIFTFENELWFFTQTYIFNIDRNKKFLLDAVIYDVKVVKDSIIVIKDDWKYIKKYIKQGILKKKYSTK